MNRRSENYESRLETALKELEDQLETPAPSGELRDWLARAETLLNTTQRVFCDEAMVEYASQRDAIVNEDLGLNSQAEQLAEEDASVAKELERLIETVRQIYKFEEADEYDEAKVEASIQQFTGESLALVIRIRMQIKSMATWFTEAFQRDSGVAD